MIVSVTVLGGAAANGIEAIAAGVVRYLEEGRTIGGPRGGSVIELPAPEGGTVAYYADTKGTRPARWALGHRQLQGEVDPRALAAVLSGNDPTTGEVLDGRNRQRFRSAEPIMLDPAQEWFTTSEVAHLLGVSRSYARLRLAKLARGDSGNENAGERKIIKTPDRGWLIRRDALERWANDRRVPRVVVGYDLTFSVPKSVSVLWAAGDDVTRAAILESIDEAVAAGLRYADRHALVVRSKGGQERADGVYAADYLHTTSRALEPQLHHHVVIANHGRAADGSWRALDARLLFAHAKTIGYLSAAELRHQLTARLGVTWRPLVNGVSDLEMVPEAALQLMSSRSAELRAEIERLGLLDPATGVITASAAGRQIAVWSTRAPKTNGVDFDALARVWDQQLTASGFDQQQRAAVLRRVVGPGVFGDHAREELFAQMARIDGITADQAVFDRRHVVQKIATEAHEQLSGDAIDHLVDAFLARPEIVRLEASLDRSSRDVIRRADGRVVAIPVGERFSSKSMLAIETRAVAMYEHGRGANALVVNDHPLDTVLNDEHFAHLSEEQRRFVTDLVRSGQRIQAAVGPAGTGKTLSLEVAIAAWERSGLEVLGCAVGGSQTVVLGEQAGIEATTVRSVLTRYYQQGDTRLLNGRTVLLVDEASLLSTHDFAQLASAVVESGSILRLVGDPAQHSAVAAGGMFRYIVDHFADDVPALTHIYRQEGPTMAEVRLANAEFRETKFAEALDRLERDGRITEAKSAEEAYDLLACAWYAERGRRILDPTRQRTSMTAEHHFERQELNTRARVFLVADGTLHGPEVVVAGIAFQAGDEVIARVVDHELRAPGAPRQTWVRNGSRGVIQEVNSDRLLVEFERWGTVEVPTSYIDQEIAPGIRGGLQHAYALTTFAAQGETHAVATPLLSDASTPEGTYVGITRGRFDLQAVVVRRRVLTPALTDNLLPQLLDERGELESLARRLEGADRETLASSLDADASRVGELAATTDLTRLRLAMSNGVDGELYGRAITERARRVGMSAITAPSEEILAQLGPRPSSGAERGVWDRAVSASAIWREREQVIADPKGNGVKWALGDRPDDQHLAIEYDEIATLINTARALARSTDDNIKRVPTMEQQLQGEPVAELDDEELLDRYLDTSTRWQDDENELRRLDDQLMRRNQHIAEHPAATGVIAILQRAIDVDTARRDTLAQSVEAEVSEMGVLRKEITDRDLKVPELADTNVVAAAETEPEIFFAPPEVAAALEALPPMLEP